MTTGNELQEVIVKGQAAALRKTGSSESISAEDIDNKATVDRTLQDILAMSPYYIGSGSFGGRDGGMNNYSIDGANFNANMGLDREKMPGAGTPFALEALETSRLLTQPSM